MSLPPTIKHPETFLKSPSAGFDGVFDWSWTDGCFGEGRITPMDFDGLVERKGNFILFETKDVGVSVPKGQIYTFQSAYNLGCFTIIFIEGKTYPEFAKAWCQPGFSNGLVMDQHAPVDLEKMRKFVSDWYGFADKNPRQKVDISFLNKRISDLDNQVSNIKTHLTNAVKELGGSIVWGAKS